MEDRLDRRTVELLLKLLWSFLIVLVVLGVAVPLTVFLDWWKLPLPLLLGSVAGTMIAVGIISSPQGRGPFMLGFGMFFLPASALYLGSVAAGSSRAFSAYSTTLVPFIVYAAAGASGIISFRAVWSWQSSAVKEDRTAEIEPVEPPAPVEMVEPEEPVESMAEPSSTIQEPLTKEELLVPGVEAEERAESGAAG